MKLTIGYTAYHEIEMEAPPDIEEAYHKYQKMGGKNCLQTGWLQRP